eukprot:gene8205-1467_t
MLALRYQMLRALPAKRISETRAETTVLRTSAHVPRRCASTRYRETNNSSDASSATKSMDQEPASSMETIPTDGEQSLLSAPEQESLKAARIQPGADQLEIWQTADAVVFDVDCTLVGNNQLDLLQLLADYKEIPGGMMESITEKVAQGALSEREGLEQKLKLINIRPADVRHCLAKHKGTPQSRLNAVSRASDALCTTACHPERECVRSTALTLIKDRYPYHSVVMVGDDASDLAAVQEAGGVDLFVG